MYLSFICIMSNKTTVIHIGRGATRTFARGGGNILFCNGLVGGGLRAGFPPFRKFLKTKVLFYGRKKGNFKLLHADLAVFNSN